MSDLTVIKVFSFFIVAIALSILAAIWTFGTITFGPWLFMRIAATLVIMLAMFVFAAIAYEEYEIAKLNEEIKNVDMKK